MDMTPQIRLSTEAQRAQDARDIDNRDCRGCIHFKVCKVPPVMLQMIPGLFPPVKAGPNEEDLEPTTPINPMDIAKICSEYLKASGVLTA